MSNPVFEFQIISKDPDAPADSIASCSVVCQLRQRIGHRRIDTGSSVMDGQEALAPAQELSLLRMQP